MTKVQLTLTDEEAALLTGYGEALGYSLPKTIKFLLSKAAEKVYHSRIIPVYELPQDLEEQGLAALKEYQEGKTTEVTDFETFFKNL